jgi:hypothetical protein
MRVAIAALVGLVLSGCGGGGDGSAPGPEPASVAGRWQLRAPTNGDVARAVDCTGDARAFEGQTANQILAPNNAGLDAGGGIFIVRQDASTFFFERVAIGCVGGGQGTESGGGTVRGSELEGHVDRNCPGFVDTIMFSGTVSGTTLTIRETRRESQEPGAAGACRWQPPIEHPGTIQR